MKSSQLQAQASAKINKSTVWEPAVESETILRKEQPNGSGNFSAVYQGDLSKSKREQF